MTLASITDTLIGAGLIVALGVVVFAGVWLRSRPKNQVDLEPIPLERPMDEELQRRLQRRVIVRKECPICGRVENLLIDRGRYARWTDGAVVQEIFPELTPVEREQLITGLCSDECWQMSGSPRQGEEHKL